MAAASEYLSEKILGSVLNGDAFPVPAETYLALSTTATSDVGAITEPGAGYARVSVQGIWGIVGLNTGLGQNISQIIFPSAGEDWGTITHIAFFDAAVGGNMLIHGPLEASVSVTSGQTARFLTQDLQLVVD